MLPALPCATGKPFKQGKRKSRVKNSCPIVDGAWAKEGQKPLRAALCAGIGSGHEGSGRGNICCGGVSRRPRGDGKVWERLLSPHRVVQCGAPGELQQPPLCPPPPPWAHAMVFSPFSAPSPFPAAFRGFHQEGGETNPPRAPGEISLVKPKLLKLSSNFYFLWGRSWLK